MKKIITQIITSPVALALALFAMLYFSAFAADGIKYNLLAPFSETKEVSTFSDYLSGALPFILRMAAVFAVVQIVVGGFQYALSEAMGTKQDAKDRMTQAIVGLILALASYLILYTINPNLVNLNIGIVPISQIPGIHITDPSSSPPQYHLGCISNTCTQVAGSGADDCSACGGTGNSADTCPTGQVYCRWRTDSGLICSNQCTPLNDCLKIGQEMGATKPTDTQCPVRDMLPDPNAFQWYRSACIAFCTYYFNQNICEADNGIGKCSKL